MARAFEAAIESFTDIRNQYLVSGTTFSHLNDSGAYPDEAHRKAILNALTNYFGMSVKRLSARVIVKVTRSQTEVNWLMISSIVRHLANE